MPESSVELELPSWFKGRQGRVEDLGNGAWRISGPNLREAVVVVRMTEGLTWQAAVRETADGPDVAATEANISNPRDAVQAAFELFRQEYAT